MDEGSAFPNMDSGAGLPFAHFESNAAVKSLANWLYRARPFRRVSASLGESVKRGPRTNSTDSTTYATIGPLVAASGIPKYVIEFAYCPAAKQLTAINKIPKDFCAKGTTPRLPK